MARSRGSDDGEQSASRVPARIIAHAQRAAAMFAERFDRTPTLAAFAPGRVNLIGEHTDYSRGFALPIAIERETVIVADRADRRGASTLALVDVGETLEVDLTRPIMPLPNSRGNYVLGVAEQFRRAGIAAPGLDALVTSTVPIGSGLSSSAAVEVAFATLLERAAGVTLSPLDKARLCQAAEHEFAGTPCGIIDMLTSISAQPNHALLIDCRSEGVRAVPADFARHGATLLVIDTGARRELAGSAYSERRATCASVAAALGRPSLREAVIDDLNMHGLSNIERRRALHVISENTRTILAAEALALGDLRRVGELMFASHASLRDLYQVSCPELDAIVETAAALRDRGAGILGARMTGAGFGGCAIVMCEVAKLDRVICELSAAFAARFGREPTAMFTSDAVGAAQVIPWSGGGSNG